MCEICGGPHFTCHCSYSAGYSADYFDRSYSQVQSYGNYKTQEELLAWVKNAREEREREIQEILIECRVFDTRSYFICTRVDRSARRSVV